MIKRDIAIRQFSFFCCNAESRIEYLKDRKIKLRKMVCSMHERHYHHCHEQRGDYFTVSTSAFVENREVEKKHRAYRATEGGLTLMCTHIPIVILAPYITLSIYTDNV